MKEATLADILSVKSCFRQNAHTKCSGWNFRNMAVIQRPANQQSNILFCTGWVHCSMHIWERRDCDNQVHNMDDHLAQKSSEYPTLGCSGCMNKLTAPCAVCPLSELGSTHSPVPLCYSAATSTTALPLHLSHSPLQPPIRRWCLFPATNAGNCPSPLSLLLQTQIRLHTNIPNTPPSPHLQPSLKKIELGPKQAFNVFSPVDCVSSLASNLYVGYGWLPMKQQDRRYMTVQCVSVSLELLPSSSCCCVLGDVPGIYTVKRVVEKSQWHVAHEHHADPLTSAFSEGRVRRGRVLRIAEVLQQRVQFGQVVVQAAALVRGCCSGHRLAYHPLVLCHMSEETRRDKKPKDLSRLKCNATGVACLPRPRDVNELKLVFGPSTTVLRLDETRRREGKSPIPPSSASRTQIVSFILESRSELERGPLRDPYPLVLLPGEMVFWRSASNASAKQKHASVNKQRRVAVTTWHFARLHDSPTLRSPSIETS
ncbi:hypothetical protein B566_EDAN010283 [Ephemera danica]|nr:hypothetical protein B566_EDAN010283 [Ephemera danica]